MVKIMKIYKIPTINESLFSFNLIFAGKDIISGDRHFLEHLLFKSNKIYNTESLTKEITKLGGLNALKIETSPEEISIRATILKKDAPKIINLLNAILNESLFLEEEIDKERKIILQEYYNRVKEQRNIYIRAFGNIFNEDLSVIGPLENIENMNGNHLITLYNKLINRNNAILFLHNGEDVLSLLNIKDGSHLNNIKEIKIKGEKEQEVGELPFSVINLFYDEKPSLASYALKDYLNEMDAPFFRILREKKNYCYFVKASQTFAGLNHLFPFFNTMCITMQKRNDLKKVSEELEKQFIVDNEEIYKNVLNTSALNKIKAKNDINLRFAFAYTTYLLDCSFEDLSNKPTWDDLRDFSCSVREKLIGGTYIIGNENCKMK